MFLYAGETIFISGITITIALGGMITIPVSSLSTTGLSISTGIICTVLLNMTLMPALLLIFFDFFRYHCIFPLPTEFVIK